MKDEIITPNFAWLDNAFAKGYVDELEAACCLTDGQPQVIYSDKVTNNDVEFSINPKVRDNYNIIVTWSLGRRPLFAYIDKALEQGMRDLRRLTLLKKCEDYLSNLTEDKQIKFLNQYPYINKYLRLLLRERPLFGRYEYKKAPSDFTRLTVSYSLIKTQKILEEAEKANFSVFAKIIWPDATESYVSLTPPEVTVVRNNSPDKTNVIIGFFYCNIFELWVSKTDADKLLSLFEDIQTASLDDADGDTLSEDEVEEAYLINPADRRVRLFRRAVDIAKEFHKLGTKPTLSQIHSQLIEEEKGKSNVSKHTLKHEVKFAAIKKELKRCKSEEVN